jgi:hypothetical protein
MTPPAFGIALLGAAQAAATPIRDLQQKGIDEP